MIERPYNDPFNFYSFSLKSLKRDPSFLFQVILRGHDLGRVATYSSIFYMAACKSVPSCSPTVHYPHSILRFSSPLIYSLATCTMLSERGELNG